MPEENMALDLSNISIANEIDNLGEYLIDAFIAEGEEAYDRHVERRLADRDKIYPLHQLTAIAAGEPLAQGFDHRTARTARMILCSYILGLSEVLDSFKDLEDYQLYLLYGILRSTEYSGLYYADLLNVYNQLSVIQWA